MKNILITGAAGFIGSNLALALQVKYPDAYIVGIDDFSSGDYKNLQGFKGEIAAFDMSNPIVLTYFSGIKWDYVIHLASITDTTVTNQKEMIYTNVEGFRNALILAEHAKAPVLFASSCAVYGKRDTILEEEDKLAPVNVYGFSKVQLENLAANFHKMTGLPVCGLRFSNIYGLNEGGKFKSASMIYQIIEQYTRYERCHLFKDGNQKRDWFYIGDLISLILNCMETQANGIYNAGSGVSYSFNELSGKIAFYLKKKPEICYLENPYQGAYQEFTQTCMEKVRHELKWVPRYILDTALKEMICP